MCALKHDFEQFTHSNETFVGEREITLKGGQKPRINLARHVDRIVNCQHLYFLYLNMSYFKAVYKQADVYLLDDPLSSIDITVGKHLYQKCIRGIIKTFVI